MRQINFRKKGTSIVEALVALAILAITGSAIVLLLAQISSLNNSAKIKNQATSYAEQTMELVRGFDQTNGWANLALKGNSSGICYSDGNLNPPSVSCIPSGSAQATCGAGVGAAISPSLYPASYRRSVKVITTGSQVQIISTVCWLDKGHWNKTESNTYYYDY